jgi:hypothetical protein
MNMKKEPFLSVDCNQCRANCHEFSHDEKTSVMSKCGDLKPIGSCYGLVWVPYINPSANAIKGINDLMHRQ